MFFLLACLCAQPQDSSEAWPEGLDLGDEVACQDPVDGFDRLSLRPGALEQALTNEGETDPCGNPPGALVAQDLDGDGDPEVLLLEPDGLHTIWDDREGQLHPVPVALATERKAYTLAAGDLDGDGLPELIVGGADLLLVARNQGGLRFSDWEVVLDEPAWPRSCALSFGFGDVDGDGDLDLSVANADFVPDEDHVSTGNLDDPGAMAGSADRLYLNEDGVLSLHRELDSDPPRMSLLHAWTDRDQDGDLDLLATTDRYLAGRIGLGTSYRNDGSGEDGPLIFEDGAAIGFQPAWSVMGLISWDPNEDGWLDHCFTDIQYDLPCIQADGAGGFYELDLGLHAAIDEHPQVPEDWYEPEDRIWREYAPWSAELLDVDADGYEDVFVVAGPPPELGNALYSPISPFQPDWLWQGSADGLQSRGLESDWSDPAIRYALVQADLDGDGFRELIKSGDEGSPQVFDNPCGAGSWVEVEVLNAAGGPAYGAQVRVLSGQRSWMREVQGPRVMGQSVAPVHVGLGSVDEIGLVVSWPDGTSIGAEGLPVNRRIVARPP